MITILTGDNSFESERALQGITSRFGGQIETIDGDDVQLAQLPDLLMGASLFSESRLVVIRGLSENKTVWPVFGDWATHLSSDIELVLVEPKLDKRTSTYKSLKEHAKLEEFLSWGDRDARKAEEWVESEAATSNIKMDKKCVQTLVQRIGPDQWMLYRALEKLAVLDEVTVDIINDIIDVNPVENVFNLFETALERDVHKLKQTLTNLEKSEDPYRLFALLSGQAFQLAAVASASSTDNVAKDFAIHPFVLSKLNTAAKRLGRAKVASLIEIFADADDDMKISKADPWLLIERALVKVTQI